MGRPVDFEKKIEELRGYLVKYNGIPKQSENHAAHANLKYYIKNYSDRPEIKALIDEFHLGGSKDGKKTECLEQRIEDVKSILEKYQRIPKDNKDYNAVYYFFNRYKDNPDVKKLMFIYSHPDCFMKVTGSSLSVYYRGSRRYKCDITTATKYIRYVFTTYGVAPARKTAPMQTFLGEITRFEILSKKFKYPVGDKFRWLFNFLKEMKEHGCNIQPYVERIKAVDDSIDL